MTLAFMVGNRKASGLKISAPVTPHEPLMEFFTAFSSLV